MVVLDHAASDSLGAQAKSVGCTRFRRLDASVKRKRRWRLIRHYPPVILHGCLHTCIHTHTPFKRSFFQVNLG